MVVRVDGVRAYQRELFPVHAEELVVDNFAGGGGASIGISRAIGRSVDVAINHDPVALRMHEINHPETRHYCENIRDVDPVVVCGGRPVGMAWFSPDCTHHSKAKGGRPRKKEIRGLAWIVLRWAARVRPRVIFLENVEEFQDWCPLRAGRPVKSRRGQTFQRWKAQLEALGYAVEYRRLHAHDYGAPTTRRRLFVVARCDGQPIVWPKPTHGVGRGLKPYRTAAECIDWGLPCPSIFLSKAEARALRVIRPLSENTLKRIAKGIQKYVIDSPQPFIVAYHSQETFRGQSVEEPLRTQTTENRFGLVAPYLTTVNHGAGDVRGYTLADPLGTITGKGQHALCAASLVQTGYGERAGQAPRALDIEAPLGTVVAGGAKHALCSAFLTKFYGTSVGCGLDAPLPAVTSQGNHLAEVRAFLMKYYAGGEGQSLRDPMHTITTLDRFGLVTVSGLAYQIMDIGLRMLQPRELARAQGMPEDYVLTGTKTQQVKAIGNSVSPPPAEALVRANYRAAGAAVVGATA